jgi:hypothetical protein
LIKIIRLIANLVTVDEIGNDLLQTKSVYFKDLLKKLRHIIGNKSIEKDSEMIQCSLSCLANLLFFDKSYSSTLKQED